MSKLTEYADKYYAGGIFQTTEGPLCPVNKLLPYNPTYV